MESSGAQLKVIFGGCTKSGRKKRNDDMFSAFLPKNLSTQFTKGAFACLADGVSDSRNGRLASNLACETILADYYSTPDYWSVKNSLSLVINSLNSWFVSQSQRFYSELNSLAEDSYATTICCLVIKSNTAHIFHAGDSRVYHIRNDQIDLLTEDHSYSLDGSVTILEQALGINESLRLNYSKVSVLSGDRFLLSSDGVHSHLSAKKLLDICSDKSLTLEQLAHQLVDVSLSKNDSDNATALLIHVDSLPEMKLSELSDRLLKLEAPPLLKPGDHFDSLLVVRRIAKNARNLIYIAKDEKDGREYVIKTPSKELMDDRDYMEGFALEKWLTTRLEHERIIKGFNRHRDSQYLYLKFEYLEGATLRSWMDDRGPISLKEARTLLKELIKPIRVLHRNNIVHRDLKPENFMFDRKGVLKLIDLGTAEIGSLNDDLLVAPIERPLGDIKYLAPEYLVIGAGSYQSDLFSLAAIIYELISGELPYAAILSNQDNPRHYEFWQYRSLFVNDSLAIDVPYWVDNVLKKALSPNKEERYQTLSEFEAQINQPTKDSLALTHTPFIKRNPLKFYQALSFILSLLVLFLLVLPYIG